MSKPLPGLEGAGKAALLVILMHCSIWCQYDCMGACMEIAFHANVARVQVDSADKIQTDL
jgi:hypothetical protein